MSLEIAAAERRKAIARNERLDDYDELCYGDFDELLWEEFFYRTTEDAFNSELAAYSPLQDLQGVATPMPRLSTINPSSVPRSLARSLIMITTVCSFPSYGIIHCDLHTDNILFSQQPSRVVVIDFGQSILRENESDSEWESAVETEGNEVLVKLLLHKAGIRYLPIPSARITGTRWSTRKAAFAFRPSRRVGHLRLRALLSWCDLVYGWRRR